MNELWIIDDDKIFQFAAKTILKNDPFFNEIIPFSNGKEALVEFEKRLKLQLPLPFCILLDINMPVMDGWGFLAEIEPVYTKEYEDIWPSIHLLSSSYACSDRKKSKGYSCIKGFLSKPLSTQNIDIIKSK